MLANSARGLHLLLLISLFPTAGCCDDAARLERQRAPKPDEIALVFSNGYGPGDEMPKEDERFEKLLVAIKEAGFNTVHCIHTDSRLALCKKHSIKMMVHLLCEEHHVYKNPDRAKALCEKLRGNSAVWGYNIWNDTFAKTGEGRRRDINTVRGWDPTHPAYCGTYRTVGIRHIPNADILGYYDFHWKRDLGMHFPHLLTFWNMARENNSAYYTWLSASSGQAGKGNFNRNLYSVHTGMACGLKGILWFLGTDLMDPKTLEWKPAGKDIRKVHERVRPVSKELAALGQPAAIYTTTITKSPNNEPLPKEQMPGGLSVPFPKEFRLQPLGGEFVMGVFKDAGKREVWFLANHNAYAEQQVVLKLMRPGAGARFDRKTGDWVPNNVTEGAVKFRLEPAGGELLRFGAD